MTTTESGEGKESLKAVIDALTTAIEKVDKPGFRHQRAKNFLQAIKDAIVAWCSCQQANGSYYEYPE